MKKVSGKILYCKKCKSVQVIHFRDSECQVCGVDGQLSDNIPKTADRDGFHEIYFTLPLNK